MRIIRAALLLGLLMFALTQAAVVISAEALLSCCRVGAPDTKDAPTLEVAVVLGGPMDPDGTLAYATRRRVEAGVRLLADGGTERLLFSGGPSEGPQGSPAARMRDHAVTLGADPARLMLEPRSSTTLENMRFSGEILAANGWTRAGLVTDAWHLARARALAAWVWDSPPRPIAVAARPWMWTRDTPVLYMREALAWWLNAGKWLAWHGMALVGVPEAERNARIR